MYPAVTTLIVLVLAACIFALWFKYKKAILNRKLSSLRNLEFFPSEFFKERSFTDNSATDDRYRLFNPSLFRRNGELYTVHRVSNDNKCPSRKGKTLKAFSKIYITAPNGNSVKVDYEYPPDRFRCASGLEDSRSFTIRDKLYLVATDPQMKKCRNQMKLLEFGLDLNNLKVIGSIVPDRIIPLIYAPAVGTTQKNWAPFVKDESLYFIYRTNPHVILKCDINTGKCTEEAVTHNELVPDDLHGGTPAKLWGDCYITLSHVKYPLGRGFAYTTVFLTFNKDHPFDITAMSSEFFFEEYDGKNAIQFASGLEIITDDKGVEKFYISYGLQDCDSRIVSIPSQTVRNSLVNTPAQISLPGIVDCTIVISLARHADRWKLCEKRLKELGLKPELFEAVDGFKVGKDVLKSYGALDERPGIAGCIASHANVWRQVVARNIPVALICEDDAIFHEDFKKLFPLFWAEVPYDFHMIQIGHCGTNLGRDLVVNKAAMCMQAYIVSHEGAKQLLADLIPCKEPIDIKLVEKYRHMPRHRMFLFNGSRYPSKLKDADRKRRKRAHNKEDRNDQIYGAGLVFQDRRLGSTIHQMEVVH